MSLSSMAYREVDTMVSTWTSKYQYHISLLQSSHKMVKLMVEFSLTKCDKPIPIGTVRVYFTCSCEQDLKITFRFQKDSLIHELGKTIRQKQIQNWIDDCLKKKLLVRQTVFYLGTTYEETRVKDQRLTKLLQQPIVQPEQQYCYIDPQLLKDQQRFIDIMEQPHKDISKMESDMKMYFREIDDENIGVVTREQFLNIIRNLGLKINQKQQHQLLQRVDGDNYGTVDFQKYKQVVKEILQAQSAKSQAQQLIQLKKQEDLFATILSFIKDDVQEVEDQILSMFRKQEGQQDNGLTYISEVKSVLNKINDQMSEDKKQPLLTPLELAELVTMLTDTYGYKSIPYHQIHRHIVEFKIKNFSAGLTSSKVNNLELYIRNVCDEKDEKKSGKIKLMELIEVMEKGEKIKLTKAQIYLLESILPLNEMGEINYLQNCKFLAEVMKKFYIFSCKRKVQNNAQNL